MKVSSLEEEKTSEMWNKTGRTCHLTNYHSNELCMSYAPSCVCSNPTRQYYNIVSNFKSNNIGEHEKSRCHNLNLVASDLYFFLLKIVSLFSLIFLYAYLPLFNETFDSPRQCTHLLKLVFSIRFNN